MEITTKLEKEFGRSFYYATATTLDPETGIYKIEFSRRNTGTVNPRMTIRVSAWIENGELRYIYADKA